MVTAGELVMRAREAAGLSKAELADRINLSPSMVSRIEANKVRIEPDVFMRLTTELRGLKPAELASAIGYQVTVPGAERLPRPLVSSLLEMNEDELDALTLLVQRRRLSAPPQEARVR